MMAITTNNSIKVNPSPGCLRARLQRQAAGRFGFTKFSMRQKTKLVWLPDATVDPLIGWVQDPNPGKRFRFPSDVSQLHTLVQLQSPQGFKDSHTVTVGRFSPNPDGVVS